jgi:hypothetical protein
VPQTFGNGLSELKIYYNSPVSIYNVNKFSGALPPNPQKQVKDGGEGRGREGKGRRERKGKKGKGRERNKTAIFCPRKKNLNSAPMFPITAHEALPSDTLRQCMCATL